jgi:hypothetical protein
MIASSAVYQLKSSFRGELIGPGDEQYDAARTVFNVTINRRPALIARCAGADDVMQAVNFARKENLLLSVRGTGCLRELPRRRRRHRWTQGGLRREAGAPRGTEGEVRPHEPVPDEPEYHARLGRRCGRGSHLKLSLRLQAAV